MVAAFASAAADGVLPFVRALFITTSSHAHAAIDAHVTAITKRFQNPDVKSLIARLRCRPSRR